MNKLTFLLVLLVEVWTNQGGTGVHGTSLKDGSFLVAVETKSWEQLSRCSFPDTIRLTMTSLPFNKMNTSLHLIRHQADHPIPVYSMSSGDMTHVPLLPTMQRKAFYFSASNDANLQITCIGQSINKQTFKMEGVINVNNQEYLVQSLEKQDMTLLPALLESWGGHKMVVNLRPLVPEHRPHDYIVSEKSRLVDTRDPIPRDIQISRQRRSVGTGEALSVTSFTVEVLAVVDYSVYSTWYSGTGRDEGYTVGDDRDSIREYYRHVIKGVDLRYKNIGYSEFQIHIVLSGVIIIETLDSCPWLNETQGYDSKTGDNDLNADYALNAFKVWINETEALPAHDHAILFTKYDLYTSNKLEKTSESKVSQTSGLAFIGTLCDAEDSVSIVEEQGGFQSVGTVAHEIGHSLGALHDGENNTCLSDRRYIMAASGFGPVPETEKYNPWFFSECSVENFKQFIATQLTDGSTCLLDANNQSDRPSMLPGQLFNPDEQCKMIWGPNSYLCRGAEFGDSASICTSMYCRDPSTPSDCVLHTAARGTSCGNKQWCEQGKCVYSAAAPSKRESCVLGDQPGPAFNGMTCAEIVAVSASYCYQEKVRARCCGSCGTRHTLLTGCEYGDRIKGCRPWHCDLVNANRDIKSECCSTCKHGQPMTTTVSPSQNNNNVVSVLVDPINRIPDNACEDRDVRSGESCIDLIQSQGRYMCYDDMFSGPCCRSCSRVASKSAKDCAYGDRTPDLCSRIANRTDLSCSKFRSHCCESCVKEAKTGGSTSVHDNVLFLVTVMAAIAVPVILKHSYDFG